MDDTPNKVLERVVVALGGSKQVAGRLWPDKGIDEARRLLCDCLSDERPAKLDFSQVLFILKLARERGIHDGINYICASLSYAEPQPIEPRDEAAELQRQYIEAARMMGKLADRIERLAGPLLTRAA